MLALARFDHIDLTTTRLTGAGILAAHPKENDLGHISEIEPDSSPIRAAILTDFVPNDVRFVLEAPRLHHAKRLGQKGVRCPQIEMRWLSGEPLDRKRLDIVESHRLVSG